MPDQFFLEKAKPMRDSLLWKLQDSAYSQFGPEAWSAKGVPFYVTSNPWIASAYAQVVLGFLRDSNLNWDEPLYILDLGAGSGRFAFFFLQEFSKLIYELPFEKLKIRYVLTDFAEKNLQFWKNHPSFSPYFESGMLDFGLYRHDYKSEKIKLQVSKTVLSKKTVKNPLILIANYFFDTIPQDLFRVQSGKLEEGLVTLSTKSKYKKSDPKLINDLNTDYHYRPVKNPRDPILQKLLKEYQKNLEGCSFLFPMGAFQSIDYFADLSESLLLLAGDQGSSTEEQLRNLGEPKPALHGSFSMAVSYHALAKFFELKGGTALLTSMPDPSFANLVGILPKGKFPETRHAFASFIDHFEPRDYWRLSLEAEKKAATLTELLLLIKLGHFDPMSFNAFFEKIREKLPGASDALKQDLKKTIAEVWKRFFLLSPQDGAFVANLGVLCFELQDYRQALNYFQKAITLQGESNLLLKNLGACYMQLNKLKEAKQCFEKALKTL